MTLYEAGPIEVRDTLISDLFFVADHMRESDKREIWRMSHKTPAESLLKAYNDSDIRLTLTSLSKPVALFGVALSPDDSRAGLAWLLATDDLNQIKREFLTVCKVFLPALLTVYSVLYNYVDSENTKSIRWLKWLGAHFEPAKAIGPHNHDFIKFTLGRS